MVICVAQEETTISFFPSAGISCRDFPVNMKGSTESLIGLLSIAPILGNTPNILTKHPISIFGFGIVVFYSLISPASNESGRFSWHVRIISPTVTNVAERITSILNSTSVSLAVESFFEATAQAALQCLCDSSIGGVCHTAIIQSHLKCSPLGSNTTLGSNK